MSGIKFINVMVSSEQHMEYQIALKRLGRSMKQDISEYVDEVIKKSQEKGKKK